MPRLTWPLLLLLAPALSAQAAAPSEGAGTIDAPALFAASCAQCHGLDGSGTGPTVLDRPARNFKEGGFSFGNTVETIARTIAYGIPGSPMPAFEPAFSIEQMRALAEYVVTLGPPVKEVTEAETLLHVTDRPLIVRGILPPLEEGGPMIPRGLLIGTPDGLTFQYAADDVRLLAVRQGDFVKRTDWGGRGGTPLEPLGKVVWTAAATEGLWFAARAQDSKSVVGDVLAARLLSTGGPEQARLSYALIESGSSSGTGRAKALVVETVERSPNSLPADCIFAGQVTAAGIQRQFTLSPVAPSAAPTAVVLDLGAGFAPMGDAASPSGAVSTAPITTPEGPRTFSVWNRGLGTPAAELRFISAPVRTDGTPAFFVENSEHGLRVRVVLDQPASFTITTHMMDGSTPFSVPAQNGER